MIQLRGDGLVWTGEFQVEVFNAETITLPVGPRYQVPDGTMDLVLRGVRVNPRAVGAVASPRVRLPRLGTVASIVSGVGLLIFTIGYLGISLILSTSVRLGPAHRRHRRRVVGRPTLAHLAREP